MMSAEETFSGNGIERKSVRSLQLQCQIQVLKHLHEKSTSLEKDYFDKFFSNLSVTNQRLEQMTDIRHLDSASLVAEFEAKLKSKEAEEAKKMLSKGKVKNVGGSKNRPSGSKREGLRPRSRPKPYEVVSPNKGFLNAIKTLRKEAFTNNGMGKNWLSN